MEAYKNWMFVKKNQYFIPMNEDWKNYWAQRIIDSYNKDEYARIDGHSDQGVSTYAFERQSALQGSPATEKPLDVKAYIINTDNSDKPGEHWVALYFKDDKAIYFDSYGQPPLEDYILPFIQRNTTTGRETTEMLQSPWSKVCGMYCIYILHQLSRGLDLKTAIH